jgi:hypothetical protein
MQEDEFGNQPVQEDLGVGLKIVSFCFPIVGAVLYFVWKNDHPKKSKQACNFALIGFAIGVVINIILAVAGIGLGAMGADSY